MLAVYLQEEKNKKTLPNSPACSLCLHASLSLILLQPGQSSASTASPSSDAGGVGNGITGTAPPLPQGDAVLQADMLEAIKTAVFSHTSTTKLAQRDAERKRQEDEKEGRELARDMK